MDTSLDKRELSTGHVGFFDVRREFKSKIEEIFFPLFLFSLVSLLRRDYYVLFLVSIESRMIVIGIGVSIVLGFLVISFGIRLKNGFLNLNYSNYERLKS